MDHVFEKLSYDKGGNNLCEPIEKPKKPKPKYICKVCGKDVAKVNGIWVHSDINDKFYGHVYCQGTECEFYWMLSSRLIKKVK